MQLSPENAEEYIDYLHSIGRLDEAAVRLAAVVNDEGFVSKEGKSNYQVFTHRCPLFSCCCCWWWCCYDNRTLSENFPYSSVCFSSLPDSCGTSCVT